MSSLSDDGEEGTVGPECLALASARAWGDTPAFGWRGRRARVRVAVVVVQYLAAGALRPEPCAYQQLRAALPSVLLRGSCSALILACLLLTPPLPPLLGAVAEYHADICACALSKCGLRTAAQQARHHITIIHNTRTQTGCVIGR